jgi:hypothetical protein
MIGPLLPLFTAFALTLLLRSRITASRLLPILVGLISSVIVQIAHVVLMGGLDPFFFIALFVGWGFAAVVSWLTLWICRKLNF